MINKWLESEIGVSDFVIYLLNDIWNVFSDLGLFLILFFVLAICPYFLLWNLNTIDCNHFTIDSKYLFYWVNSHISSSLSQCFSVLNRHLLLLNLLFVLWFRVFAKLSFICVRILDLIFSSFCFVFVTLAWIICLFVVQISLHLTLYLLFECIYFDTSFYFCNTIGIIL